MSGVELNPFTRKPVNQHRGDDRMLKRIIYVILVLSIVSLSGCATMRKQQVDLEIEGLRNQISVLEVQIQAKDKEIDRLRESLSNKEVVRAVVEKESLVEKSIPEIKFRPSVKQIQTALKNAGLNPGKIDGKMGKQTREAIRVFQRTNNLDADGKVGRKTWGLLKEYLYKKVK